MHKSEPIRSIYLSPLLMMNQFPFAHNKKWILPNFDYNNNFFHAKHPRQLWMEPFFTNIQRVMDIFLKKMEKLTQDTKIKTQNENSLTRAIYWCEK